MFFRRQSPRNVWHRLRVASCLLTLAACNVKKQEVGLLRVPLGSDPASLDPALADTGVAILALQDVVSTLFEYGPDDRLVPFDAKSFAWTDHGKKLRIEVRGDLRWSDGVRLTACHYRDAWQRLLDPGTPSTMVDLLYDIRGAVERKSGKIATTSLGVRCDEASSSLEIDVVTPYAPRLLHALAYVATAPVRMDVIARRGGDWLLPENGRAGLSSGFFAIEEWQRDRALVLRARTPAEGPAPADRLPKLRRIRFPLVRDPTTALALYESGEVDFLPELPPVLIPKLLGRKDQRRSEYFVTYLIGFSVKANPVLRDKRVRQALALSFDAAEVPGLLKGGELEARGWIPPGLLPESERPRERIRDLARAKLLLAQAGYSAKRPLPKLQLAYNPGERHQLLMERAVWKWKQELGVDVELRPTEWKVLVAELKRRAPDLYRYAWAAGYADPLFFLDLFRSDSLNNFGGWRNRDYDALVTDLGRTPLDQRDATFWTKVRRAQDILVREDPALIPVYHYVRNVLVSPRVKDLRFSGRGVESLRSVSLDE